MELFVDNDIILKLSALGILHEIEKIFKVSSESIFILPTARPFIKKNKKLKESFSEHFIEETLNSILLYQTIPNNYIDLNKALKFAEISDIDTGEQLLFSVIPKTTEFLILTGDKRSIIALNNCDGLTEEKVFIKDKIVTFEKILILLLETLVFDDLLKAAKKSNFGNDKTMKICFNQINSNIENIKECLKSYIDNLQRQAPLLFSHD